MYHYFGEFGDGDMFIVEEDNTKTTYYLLEVKPTELHVGLMWNFINVKEGSRKFLRHIFCTKDNLQASIMSYISPDKNPSVSYLKYLKHTKISNVPGVDGGVQKYNATEAQQLSQERVDERIRILSAELLQQLYYLINYSAAKGLFSFHKDIKLYTSGLVGTQKKKLVGIVSAELTDLDYNVRHIISDDNSTEELVVSWGNE